MEAYQKFLDYLMVEDCIKAEKINLLKEIISRFSEDVSTNPKKLVSETSEGNEEKTRVNLIQEDEFQKPSLLQNPLASTAKEDSGKLLVNRIDTNLPHSISESAERYILLETLGKGGMGIVERVRDTILEREVALKRIKTSGRLSAIKLSQKKLWRFQREARLTAILEHPNIIPIYDMEKKATGEILFTMRKVQGKTLKQILDEKKQGSDAYDENQLLSIFFKVCDAVAYAHSKNIIHRDLKPENIMIGAFGEVYVLDWGLAKKWNEDPNLTAQEETLLENEEKARFDQEEKATRVNENTRKNNDLAEMNFKTVGGVGTPGYMSPEQSKGGSIGSPLADVYALGKILRQCFTCISPLDEMIELSQKFYKNQKNSNAPLESKKAEAIPEDIQAIVEKATAIELTQRYQTVQELAEDVGRYQKHLWVSVRKFNLTDYLKKWIVRHQWSLTIAVGISILMISMLFSFYWKQKQDILLRYQNAFTTARENEKRGLAVEVASKTSKTQKIESLLEALNQINHALQVIPHEFLAETYKEKLAEKILPLCYETKNYELANYIAGEMQHLQILSSERKTKFKVEVDEKRNSLLKQHLLSLESWLARFYSDKPFEEGEMEDFIFEITQMEEEEIMVRLLRVLEEGVRLVLEDKILSSNQELLYATVSTIVGRLENPKAIPFLRALSEQVDNQITLLSRNQISDAKMRFLTSILIALCHLKDYGASPWIEKLRVKYQNESFDLQIRAPSKKIIDGRLQHFNHLIQQNPKNEGAYQERGLAKKDQGDLEGAIDDFSQALQFNSQSTTLYMLRGSAKLKKKDFAGALSDYTQAIQIDPQLADAYLNRGNVKFTQRDFEAAIADYTQALQINNQLSVAYGNRGNAKFEKRDFAGALTDLNQAIQLNPRYVDAYYNRGATKVQTNDLESALKDLEKVIEFNPKHTGGFNLRGNIYEAKGELEQAIQAYTKAIELNPSDSNPYYNRGVIKQKLRASEDALMDYNRAIELNPQYAQAYVNRGAIKIHKKEFNSALEDFNKAIQINPQLFYAYHARGNLLLHLEKLDEAILDYDKAYTLSSRPQILEDLLGILQEQGKRAKQKKDYAKLKETLLLMKKYIPEKDPRSTQIDQQLKKIEELLKSSK